MFNADGKILNRATEGSLNKVKVFFLSFSLQDSAQSKTSQLKSSKIAFSSFLKFLNISLLWNSEKLHNHIF